MRLALISNEGRGTGKTTSAVYMATALHRLGRTLLVDCDPQQSALTWSAQDNRLPFGTIGLPVRDVHKRLPELGADDEHVVLDSPPGDLGIITSVSPGRLRRHRAGSADRPGPQPAAANLRAARRSSSRAIR